MKTQLSEIQIDFSEDRLLALNVAMAFIMFGVALSIESKSFKEVSRNPKAIITGVVSQFLLLPFFTFLFVYFTQPLEGLALGLILVAACPGGNVSNFFSNLSGGNIALSVSLTAIATILAIILTPINFEFWSNLYLGERTGKGITLETWKMLKTIFTILGGPLLLGLLFKYKFSSFASKVAEPIKLISFVLLVVIIGLAFIQNIDIFKKYYHYIIYLVFFHNAIALGSGYLISKLVGNSEYDSRTISIETGIQNSGLGLVIIFSVFQGNGGMAIIMAWWGIWHIVGGTIMSLIFTKGRLFKFQPIRS
ncbi:MAG: bile acid:sodium symporter family protein [Cyclobacteriaceae bacterium]|nr:bile acid:sodium symporter family protein [Cyclobacteriaceae bacterium]